jgi:hypothetical protein
MLIHEHHSFLGHIGGRRLWENLLLKFEFAAPKKVKKYALDITKNCPPCEACAKPRSLRGPLGTTPIPPQLMASVALDLFNMPSVKHENQTYDMMAVCVDRLSGWVVAVPTLNKGLTGSKVAKAMLKHQWRPFGIPSVITSD